MLSCWRKSQITRRRRWDHRRHGHTECPYCSVQIRWRDRWGEEKEFPEHWAPWAQGAWLKGNRIESSRRSDPTEMPFLSIASEYYTPQEMVGFTKWLVNKIRKKVLEELLHDMPNTDFGSRKGRCQDRVCGWVWAQAHTKRSLPIVPSFPIVSMERGLARWRLREGWRNLRRRPCLRRWAAVTLHLELWLCFKKNRNPRKLHTLFLVGVVKVWMQTPLQSSVLLT